MVGRCRGMKSSTPLEATGQRADPSDATIKLAGNAEQLLWQAHQRAAELVDAEPGPISQIIIAAFHREWRNVFLHDKAA